MLRVAPLPLVAALALVAGDESVAPRVVPDMPEGQPPPLAVDDAEAGSVDAMKPYIERLPGGDVTFRMLPIPGGRFLMGSPDDEPGRGVDEGPLHAVEVSPFWMGACEVTWDEYEVFMLGLDLRDAAGDDERAPQQAWADAVSRPTPPYVPMDFNMGVHGFPAISMTQFAAKQYCKWLSMQTGRFHRLPTEAEWEFACRAGSATAYAFGDDADDLDAFAWSYENSDGRYHAVGGKRPNAFGLFDMHGNVAEWVLDGWTETGYAAPAGDDVARDPIVWPTSEYPRVVRGGSWDDEAPALRSAARGRSKPAWKRMDPQLPKSIWYHTHARGVGFRVVRPLVPPPPAERARFWEADVPDIAAIQERQRRGEK